MSDTSSIDTDDRQVMTMHVALELTRITYLNLQGGSTPDNIREEYRKNHDAVYKALNRKED